MACETCRLKKIKCDKIRPKCGRCNLRNIPCHYGGERRRAKKLDASEIEKRLHQMEAVFRHINEGFININPETRPKDISRILEASQFVPASDTTCDVYMQDIDHEGRNDIEIVWPFDGSSTTPVEANVDQEPVSGGDGTSLSTPATSRDDKHSKNRNLLDQILSGQPVSPPVENNAAVWIRTQDGDEYTGPSSGISLLSNPGLTWIENTFSETKDVCYILKGVTLDVASHLQMSKCTPPKPWALINMDKAPKPFPSEEVAWTYVEAYFKNVQCIFPALDRCSFEARLRAYFRYPTNPEIAWVALLAAVLACGCRVVLSAETPTAFEHSAAESWAYYQTAIDMVSQILYKPANLLAVEALIVMTVYAQGLSSPQRLEYTFCALASQVAQGLGLHRQPLESWNLSDFEIQERNRVFWVVYQLDKTISLRCGRPSLIDDDDISCSFPYGRQIVQQTKPVDSESSANQGVGLILPKFDFFLVYTRYARICGDIAKQLYSASALSRSSSELSTMAAELEASIDKWRDTIPYDFRPGRFFRPSDIPNDIPQIQALSLTFGYYYVICAVRRRFSAMFEYPQADYLQSGALRTADTKFLEAARSMILLTKHLDIESHTPGWLLFYYPVTALIGVFTSVVCNPKSKSGSNDIALMEVIVGHLGRLEFMTSGGTAFNRIGELVRLARTIVHRACKDKTTITHDTCSSGESDLTSEGPNNPRNIHEGSTDPYNRLRSEQGDDHIPKRRRTLESQEQPVLHDAVDSETWDIFQHEHTASSLPRLPSVHISEQDNQLHAAVNDPEPDIDLVPGRITTSFTPRGDQIGELYPTNEQLLQWQLEQRAIDDYPCWGAGGSNSVDYHQYLPSEAT